MPIRSADTARTIVLVPFAPPGNTDYQLDAATHDFNERLVKKGLVIVISKPMDVTDVASSAVNLCLENHATSILAGTVRHEHTTHSALRHPTHAEVRVSRLGCDGKVQWKEVGIGDKIGKGFGADETVAIQRALDQLISKMP